MSLPDYVKKFRLDKASDLQRFALNLEKLELDKNLSSLYQAAEQLGNLERRRNTNFDDSHSNKYNWGYSIEGITFTFDSENPLQAHRTNSFIERIILNIDVIGDVRNFYKDTVADPFKHLEFDIIIQGLESRNNNGFKNLICCFHLDRHLENPDNNSPREPHPIYHFQFGGKHLNTQENDFGNLLVLDSPRLVHYPMEAILGIDFVLSNFFPHKRREMLEEGEYISLVEEYQSCIWKPYAHTKAINWQPMTQIHQINWSPIKIWPQLIVNN